MQFYSKEDGANKEWYKYEERKGGVKEKIEQALAKVRAVLQQDGGDIELVEIDKGVVKVRLKGACSGCPMSQMTMANFVEQELKNAIPEVKKVIAVT